MVLTLLWNLLDSKKAIQRKSRRALRRRLLLSAAGPARLRFRRVRKGSDFRIASAPIQPCNFCRPPQSYVAVPQVFLFSPRSSQVVLPLPLRGASKARPWTSISNHRYPAGHLAASLYQRKRPRPGWGVHGQGRPFGCVDLGGKRHIFNAHQRLYAGLLQHRRRGTPIQNSIKSVIV